MATDDLRWIEDTFGDLMPEDAEERADTVRTIAERLGRPSTAPLTEQRHPLHVEPEVHAEKQALYADMEQAMERRDFATWWRSKNRLVAMGESF